MPGNTNWRFTVKKNKKYTNPPSPPPKHFQKKHSHIAICFSATRHRQERHIKCSFSVLSQKQPGLVYSSKWRTHWRFFLSQYLTNILLLLVLPNMPPSTLFAHLSQLTLHGTPWSFLIGVSFKTSLAAGWESSRGGRSSPKQVAACCASRSPGSLENRTSAAKHGKKKEKKKREYVIAQAASGAPGGGGGLELIWVARWLLDWICRKRTGFSIQEYLCLPCRTLPAGELQQVASCWRGRATCVRPQDQNIRVSQVLKGQITLEGNGRFNKDRKKEKKSHLVSPRFF